VAVDEAGADAHAPDAVVLPLSSYDLTLPIEAVALPHQGVNNESVGIRTGAGAFVWKTYTSYEDAAAIHYEHRLLRWLAAAGLSFAVPAPVPARDGTSLVRGPHRWAALTAWLPGARLDPANPDHVELLGDAAGELLTILQQYPPMPRPGRPLFQTLFGFPSASLDPFALNATDLGLPDTPRTDDLCGWWREESGQLRAFVDGPYRALPWQLCHNDVTPANVLVEAGRVSAMLDFEFAAPTARALDIAMGLRMTMRVWQDPEPWDAVSRFCRGYARWLPVTEAEAQVLPWLMRLRGAITVLWWLGCRGRRSDGLIVLDRIEYLRNVVRWLRRYEWEFVDRVMQEVG